MRDIDPLCLLSDDEVADIKRRSKYIGRMVELCIIGFVIGAVIALLTYLH